MVGRKSRAEMQREIARLREGIRDVAAVAIEQGKECGPDMWNDVSKAVKHFLDDHEQELSECTECSPEEDKK